MRFWKNKGKDTPPSPVGVWLIDKAETVNRHWANRMAGFAERLTLNQQKIAAIIFCILAAGYCISLIIQGFTITGKNIIKPVKAISAPVEIREKATKEASYEKDREKVARLRHYLDSLKQDDNGRLQYDSLQKFRPGLLDTLKVLEEYYQSE